MSVLSAIPKNYECPVFKLSNESFIPKMFSINSCFGICGDTRFMFTMMKNNTNEYFAFETFDVNILQNTELYIYLPYFI